ncbi:MAG: response regulator transcription factor [Acidobacteriota bacterium]|jgi:DNA-binding NarL/FixJ family response regulator|nr:response regulator transcription factor [Acidobacteriota bacterium]
MGNPYSIILADDHVLMRHGLRRILEERDNLEIAGEVGDGLELLSLLNKVNPDLIILDLSMPNLRGIEAIPEIRHIRPNAKVLMLTMHKEEEYLYQAISAGADGYLLKDDAEKELFLAIEHIQSGKIYISPGLADQSMQNWARMRRGEDNVLSADALTVRQREILKLIAEGKSNKEIGDLLYISVRTVERHRANMMSKLNVRKTAELVQYALRKHYI